MDKIIKTKPAHVQELAANLRQEDVIELTQMFGIDVSDVDLVAESVKRSKRLCRTIMHGDKVAGIFGVAHLTRWVGMPWMLCTDEFAKLPVRWVWRRSHFYVACVMMRHYRYLFNYVGLSNFKTMPWLKKLGFKIYSATPRGVFLEPFHKIELEGFGDV